MSSPVVMIFGRKKKMKIFGGWSRRTRMCKEKHLRRSQRKADNTPCFPHSGYEPSKNGINKLLKLLYLFKHLFLRWLSSARYSAYIVYNTALLNRSDFESSFVMVYNVFPVLVASGVGDWEGAGVQRDWLLNLLVIPGQLMLSASHNHSRQLHPSSSPLWQPSHVLHLGFWDQICRV